MPDLNRFIHEFKHGFQQLDRFRLRIFVRPEMIASIVAEQSNIFGVVDASLAVVQTVKWLAEGLISETCRMPDRAFGITASEMYGITEHFPIHTEMSDLETTFLLPHTTNIFNDNGVPRFFNFWQNQIHNMSDGPDSGLNFRFPSHYYSTILLSLIDRKDRETLTYQFDKAYPKLVASVPLSWAADDFTRLPVTFTFSSWKVLSHIESVELTTLEKLNKLLF